MFGLRAPEGVPDYADPEKFLEAEISAAEAIVFEEIAAGDAAAGAPAISAHQLRALQLAATQKGIRETPPGSNFNPYSAYFGFGAQFWCADIVAWAIDRTGNQDKRVPWGYPSAVRNITAWGQQHGLIHSEPRKGDIFTYKNGARCGFVLDVNGSGFMSIEGNTDGSWVKSHSRDASSGKYYFVRHHF